jgi:hypothetical protein
MKGGDKRWDQHWPQDHREYHDWKEHHIIYFLPRSGLRDMHFQRPAQRCAVFARSEAIGQQAAA